MSEVAEIDPGFDFLFPKKQQRARSESSSLTKGKISNIQRKKNIYIYIPPLFLFFFPSLHINVYIYVYVYIYMYIFIVVEKQVNEYYCINN